MISPGRNCRAGRKFSLETVFDEVRAYIGIPWHEQLCDLIGIAEKSQHLR